MRAVIEKIAWIHVQEGKILSTLSKGKSTYYIPGGKREEGESDEETLVREAKEELDVNVILDTVSFIGTYVAPSDGAAEGVMIEMTCYMSDYEGVLKASSEIDHFVWHTISDINKVSAVDKIIYRDLFNRGLIK